LVDGESAQQMLTINSLIASLEVMLFLSERHRSSFSGEQILALSFVDVFGYFYHQTIACKVEIDRRLNETRLCLIFDQKYGKSLNTFKFEYLIRVNADDPTTLILDAMESLDRSPLVRALSEVLHQRKKG
jgi:hypothetical protein